ncbi:hypothetical protein BN14_09662 [Rhizoctonia solani AG-1 IB]|uniref:Uncharacterized protein n=1 Tax=Thanatephorus cucumeris (strain AG1-IB / isolate 7/3/14) TaxID=1108050 RepID=M5C880_THACB|nr:hypothetical protein BN14_09662 [Rhizoctonia solani AG-1 IB]
MLPNPTQDSDIPSTSLWQSSQGVRNKTSDVVLTSPSKRSHPASPSNRIIASNSRTRDQTNETPAGSAMREHAMVSDINRGMMIVSLGRAAGGVSYELDLIKGLTDALQHRWEQATRSIETQDNVAETVYDDDDDDSEALGYTGMTYMNWVVKRIGDEDLYANLTDGEKENMVKYAEELCASRLSAGSVRNGERRLTQGNIKNEIFNMCERLRYLSDKTGIKVISIVVRGDETAGLKPIYYASKKARRFLESHIRVDAEEFIRLLEQSAIGGAAELGDKHAKKKNVIKSELRDVLTDSLRDAALETASDGWKPMISDRSEIGQMSYTRYPNLVDPSQLGGKSVMSVLIAKIKSKPATAGFRRLTKSEWEDWKEKYQQQVAEGGIVKERQTRSDKGRSRKVPRAEELVSEPPKKRTKGTSKAKGSSEPNVSSHKEPDTGSEQPVNSAASHSPTHEHTTLAVAEELSTALLSEHSWGDIPANSADTVSLVLDPAPRSPLPVIPADLVVTPASSTAPSAGETIVVFPVPSTTYPLFPVNQSSAPSPVTHDTRTFPLEPTYPSSLTLTTNKQPNYVQGYLLARDIRYPPYTYTSDTCRPYRQHALAFKLPMHTPDSNARTTVTQAHRSAYGHIDTQFLNRPSPTERRPPTGIYSQQHVNTSYV